MEPLGSTAQAADCGHEDQKPLVVLFTTPEESSLSRTWLWDGVRALLGRSSERWPGAGAVPRPLQSGGAEQQPPRETNSPSAPAPAEQTGSRSSGAS